MTILNDVIVLLSQSCIAVQHDYTIIAPHGMSWEIKAKVNCIIIAFYYINIAFILQHDSLVLHDYCIIIASHHIKLNQIAPFGIT